VNAAHLDPTAYPLLLPHIGYHRDAVYFGSTRLAAVSRGEGGFLDRCDGTRTLAEAAAGCGASPDFIVGAARWLIWWPEPVAPPLGEPRRPVERLVLSPHPEDAWLGMGGRIMAESRGVPTLVQSAFQVFTGAHGARFRTTRELAMACMDEAATAARLGEVACGGFGVPEREARRLHRVPDEAARELLQIRLAELLADLRPREVFVPAALGGDADAALLLDAVLALLGGGVLEADLHLYEDAPSTHGERQVDDFLLRFEDAFVAPRRYYFDIGGVLAKKRSLLDVFACRLDHLRRRAAADGALRNAQDSGVAGSLTAERFWNIGFAALE
jgi:hypothetical protein